MPSILAALDRQARMIDAFRRVGQIAPSILAAVDRQARMTDAFR